MKKKWLIASFKINELKKVETNLVNQNFQYYLPKLITKKINSNPKEVVLFPGYIFVNTYVEKYSALQYTVGIKSIIKFGKNIAYISNEDIKAMKVVEQASKIEPIPIQIKLGQEALIIKGSLKGSIVKICSFSSKERVNVLLSFLGSTRSVNISIKDLAF